MNEIKRELENIEIPKELHNRVSLGVKQAKSEKKSKKRFPNWILSSVASLMIMGAGIAFGGPYIANAAGSLINQIFGSEENLTHAYPEESEEEIDFFDKTLAYAKKYLTEKEFTNYSQLLKEQTDIFNKVQNENRKYPNAEEEKRLDQIQESKRTYEKKFAPIQSQQLASFPFTKPTYLPEGYKKVSENYSIHDGSEEPVVDLGYSNGETNFSLLQMDISQEDYLVDMQEAGKTNTYSLNGFKFEYISTQDKSFSTKVGMRVVVPEKGYKIILSTEVLSKKEMEKVLLSMVKSK
ncbi:DUF4367 domain-containing protein [Halobacillus rhizosphaerae]|uniref:DUF4367 domain-containing protein n=1 Tax=Halobacillus rhizosphaerae TaxID=3064889 RepID=UPI00398BA9D3